MNKIKHIACLLLLFALLLSCSKDNGGGVPPVTPPSNATKVNIAVDKSIKFQTIDGFGFFGAADVWWADSKTLWDDAWGEKVVSDLGITIWRNEVWPSSTSSNPQDSDWNKAKPVVEGLKGKANKYNVDIKFIATVWSPPADLKWLASLTWAGDKDAKRWAGDAKTINGGTLDPNKYAEYAAWLNANIQLYKNSGVDLYALSLQNELMFVEPYNSCVYTSDWYNDLLNGVVPAIKTSFPNVKIFGAENMLEMEGKDDSWPYFYHAGIKSNSTATSNIDILAVHGYSDGVAASSGSALAKMWSNHLNQFTGPMNKKAWMTETSGYYDTWEASNKKPGAINLAMDIHSGLFYGNISGWVWWQGSQKTNDEFSLMSGVTTGKKYAVSKQFYRYVRPGAVRFKSIADNDEVFVTAFENTAKGTHTFVIINSGDAKSINIQGANIPTVYKMYRTSSSASENCTLIGDIDLVKTVNIEIPAKSVVTLQAGGDSL